MIQTFDFFFSSTIRCNKNLNNYFHYTRILKILYNRNIAYKRMIIPKIFERKKEKSPERLRRDEVKEYLVAVKAISDAYWIEEEDKTEAYKHAAQKILELLPEKIKLFVLSADIYAVREGLVEKVIEDEEIWGLDWVKKYSNGKIRE
jgi:hypothetical protein